MLIKAGVDISRLNRAIRRALGLISTLYSKHDSELIITSTYDGNHVPGSLHYANDAFDCRYTVLPFSNSHEVVCETLGACFDVIFDHDHIHIEYDPK